MNRLLMVLVSVAGLVAGLVACAPEAEDSSPPPWVEAGAYREDIGSSQVYFAVGSVQGVRNPALARATAENRARATLAALFSKESGPGPRSAVLVGAQVVAHWIHPEDGTVFARVRLEVDANPPAR